MNIIAIILGIISFIMMLVGILFLTTVLGPKRIKGTVTADDRCDKTGYISVIYNKNSTDTDKICVKGDKKDKDKVTLTYPRNQNPENGLKNDNDEIKIAGMNWPGILLTIFGLLGLIGSVIMFLMPQHSGTVSPNVYVNTQPPTVSVNPQPPTVYVNPQPPTVYVNSKPSSTSSTSYPPTSYPSISYPEYSDYNSPISPSSPSSLNPTMNPYY
jgi:hypothetical protein